MEICLASTGRPSADSLQKGACSGLAPDFLVWFGILCALSLVCDRIYRPRLRRAKEEGLKKASQAVIPPEEITAIVTNLAGKVLGIEPNQVDETLEKLKIPRGDYLSFLDDLEQDYHLEVPASAREMSVSINGLISALSGEA